MMSLTSSFCILTLTLVLIRIFFRRRRQKALKLPPGPTAYPLIGCFPSLLPYLRLYDPKKFLTFGQDLIRKYGDIIHLDFGFLKIVAVTHFDSMQNLKGKNFLERAHLGILERQRGFGIIMNSGKSFLEQRAFAVKTLKDFKVGKASLESEVSGAALQIIEHFKKSAATKTAIDPDEIVSLATRKTMMRILVGVDLSLDDPSLKTLEQLSLSHLVLERTQSLCLGFPTLAKMFPRVSGYESLQRALNTAHANIEQQIKEHQVKRAQVKAKVNLQEGETIPIKDFIDSYLAHMDEMGGDGEEHSSFHGDEGVKNLTMTLSDLFLASTDSTKLTVLYALLYLAHFPEVKRRAQAEIDEVVGPGRTPSLADRIKMPYMEAVISETLRKHSQAVLGFPRVATHDTEMQGYFIEKGTMVVPWYYSTLHDQTLWGPDESSVEDFNPGRFLKWDESQGKEILSKPKYFVPFGVGNRSCPGKPIAGIIIFLYLTSILQQLDFCFDDNEPRPSMEPIVTTTLAPPPFKLVFSTRGNNAAVN